MKIFNSRSSARIAIGNRTQKDFAKVFKNLVTDLKITSLDYQNNFINISSMMSNAKKKFDILAISFSAFYDYFDNATKLFSNLCLYIANFYMLLQNCLFCVYSFPQKGRS